MILVEKQNGLLYWFKYKRFMRYLFSEILK